MNSKRTLLVFTSLLTVAAGLLGGTLSNRFFELHPAHAQQAGVTTTKWEYCGLAYVVNTRKADGKNVSKAYVKYLGSKRTEEVEGTTTDEALANAFAKLGNEGWELVGPAPLHVGGMVNADNGPVYFKRIKP